MEIKADDEILKKVQLKVFCPVCNWRVCNIEKGTRGCLVIKCPNCRHVSEIPVAFRLRKPQNRKRIAALR